MPDLDLTIDDEHPLAVELASLKSSVTRFQDEAHSASVKLQRFSLDTSNAHDKLVLLERENALLKSELGLLRANPTPQSLPDPTVPQLTLSLRRLSDKLSLTEEALLARTTELLHAQSELAKAKSSEESAYALAARARGMEEEAKLKEIDLLLKVRQAKEETRISDLTVNEYANLVRSLEGRSSQTLDRNLVEGQTALQKLFLEFSEETGRLQQEILQLQHKVMVAEAKSQSAQKASEMDHIARAGSHVELEKLKLDDNTAAKMVSRYMKFSQSSTDALQVSLSSLKARHEATVDTLTTQINVLSSQLHASQTTTERMRTALDDLGKDVMRDMFGRRREVALRIRLLSREESLHEGLERLVRKGWEALERDAQNPALIKLTKEAESLLARTGDEVLTDGVSAGSFARLVSAKGIVDTLVQELNTLTVRKMELERMIWSESDEETDEVNGMLPEQSSAVQDAPTSNEIYHDEKVQDLHNSNSSTSTIQSISSAKPTPTSLEKPPIPFDEISTNDPVSLLEEQPLEEAPFHEPIISHPAPSEPRISSLTIPPSSAIEDTSEIAVSGQPLLPISAETSQDRIEVPASASAPLPTTVDASVSVSDESALPVTADTIPAAISFPTSEASPTNADAVSDDPAPLGTAEPIPDAVSFLTSESSPAESEPLERPAEEPIPVISHIPAQIIVPNYDIETPTDTPAIVVFPSDRVPSERSPHPLLLELQQVTHRYDHVQRAFRDCHIALQDLKRSISSASPPSKPFSIAVDRLNDFTEDARVELEIRIADEALVARGYETMLSIPDAMSFASPGPTDTPDLESQIALFTSGRQDNVQRALNSLTRKLEDIEHDIAALKRAFHDPDFSASPAAAPASSGSNGWTSWIRSPPTSPQRGPTFGNIVTSPRLSRHGDDPFEGLGLRVAVPSRVNRGIPGVESRGIRPRTLSTMHTLGLGARASSTTLKATPVDNDVEGDEIE
ncbi:hypothetical protein C8J56DRAFT_839445 [Mycena floridula]|nr:hypothetical protein C8J56DRAFT_839445 [Mycena floridula]